jgi:RNA polymerase sigma factor (sigma-70 family)
MDFEHDAIWVPAGEQEWEDSQAAGEVPVAVAPEAEVRGPRLDPNDPLFELRSYLREIADIPVLSRQQEVELGNRVRAHTEAFKAALCEIPFTARYALERWRGLREARRATASLSARFRDPNAGDPGPQLDRALSRVGDLLEAGVRSGAQRKVLARALARADLSMAVFEDSWKALREHTRATGGGRSGARMRAKIAAIERHHDQLLEAKNAFIRHNLKLVVHVAKRFRGLGIPFTDLIQEGNLGLIRAVEKFDPNRGFKFSTYSAWWIQQSFIRAAQNHSRTVRLPSHLYELGLRQKRAEEQLAGKLGRSPKASELAEEMGVETERLEDLNRAMRGSLPLDAELPGRDGQTLADQLPDPQSADPVQSISAREIQPEVKRLLRVLNPRERAIVRLRFGFGNDSPHTLQEIGDELGLSRERVRQLERGALDKLRGRAGARGLADALLPDRGDRRWSEIEQGAA